MLVKGALPIRFKRELVHTQTYPTNSNTQTHAYTNTHAGLCLHLSKKCFAWLLIPEDPVSNIVPLNHTGPAFD